MPTITGPNNDSVRRSRSHGTGPRWGDAAARILCLLALGAALWWSVRITAAEWRVQGAIADRAAQAAGTAPITAPDLARENAPLPPRGALARGMSLAAAAAGASGAARTTLITAARRDIQAALHARRSWPSALVGLSFLNYVEGGIGSPAAHRVLADSYEAAPYLPDEGVWRIRFGLAAWPWLSPTVRARILDEGAWQAELSPSRFALMKEIFASSSAGPAFRERLLRHDKTPAVMSAIAKRSASSV